MKIGASRTKSKIPKKYPRPSSRGHRDYRVLLTFLDSASIKTKKIDMSSTSLKRKEKEEKENLPEDRNIIQKPKYKNKHIKIKNIEKFEKNLECFIQ